MTKLGSKSSGCVEAAIGLGPEDTSRLMELHQLYADAGLASDAAIRKAANDLVAELNEEATDITKAVQALMAEGTTQPARTVADLEAEAKSITARMKARAKADRAAGLDQISDATLEANRKDGELVSSLMKQVEELKRPKPVQPVAAKEPDWFADMTDAQRGAVESFAPWRSADGFSLRRGGSGPEDDIYTSAGSSFTDFEVVPGVRSVPLSALGDLGGYDSAADADRIKKLASRISKSKEIAPIFVGVDPSGEASIMEGQHRARAFAALGIKDIPARVVVDFSERAESAREYPIAPRDEWYGEGAFSRAGGRMVYVTPDEYLAAVSPLAMDDESRENIDLLKEHIESGKTLDPLLIRASGKEDGRHRAHAAKELGIGRVPVIVYGDQFSDKPTVPAEAYGGDAPGLPLSLVDAAVAQEPDLLFSQRAYHGTPHRGIKKFTTDKMGTGEGAQAYGWGLYFASKKEIAEWYRSSLTERSSATLDGVGVDDLPTAEKSAVRLVQESSGSVEAALRAARVDMKRDTSGAGADFHVDRVNTLLAIINGRRKLEMETGQLYAVDIPDDTEMLLWDKPLSEQPEKVREALKQFASVTSESSGEWKKAGGLWSYNINGLSVGMVFQARGKWHADPMMPSKTTTPFDTEAAARAHLEDVATPEQSALDGSAIYGKLSQERGGDQRASEALMAAGIKGIKYLDDTSRNAGDGSFNYVIFSGEDVDIAEVYYSNKATDDRDLIVTHNLTEASLLHAKKMGGIPVPSLAITKKDAPIDGFGEITLIGPKELADPKGYAGTKVFGADIYSPRYPSVERELDAKQVNALKALVKPMAAKLGEGLPGDQELQRDGQRELERSGPVMAAFLEENGVEPTIVTRPGMDPAREARLREFGLGEYLDQEDYQSMMMDEKFAELAVAEYRDALASDEDRKVAKILAKQLDTNETMRRNAARAAAQEIARGARARRAPEVDRYATREALDKQINDSGLRDAYDRHVSAWLGRITKSERIYQGFTNSGNRKYTPHTLENVVKILKKELRGGESFNYGVGSLRAKITPEFKSIAAIKKEKGRLTTAADFEKVKKEVDDEFSAISSAISRDLSSDTATAILEDAIKMGALRAAKSYGYDLEPGVSDRINAFLAKLRDLPTAYFEAKVLREVSPSEFSAAVVPDDLGADAMKYLKDSGVKDIRTYRRGDEASRAAAVMGAADEGLAFSNQAKPPEQRPGRPTAVRAAPTGKISPITRKPIMELLGEDGQIITTAHNYETPEEALDKFNAPKPAAPPAPTYALPEPALPPRSNWRQVKGEKFTSLDEDDGYLYHVAPSDRVNAIREKGLVPNSGGTFGGFYANYSAGKVFLTERSGVSYWQGKVADHLQYNGSKASVSVLRIPKDKITAPLMPDEVGSSDARAAAFYSTDPIFSNQAKFQGQDLPAETRTQKTRRVAQDYFLRTKVVQDVIIGRGGQVGEAQDVYRAEERMYGRVQAQLEDFAKKWVTPMIEKAAKAGIDMDELALYAYAKHAPERNAYIDTINPAMQGAGSGMSDAAAAKIVADVQASGKAQQFEDLRQDLLAITETTRQVLLQDGLITQDEYDAWTGAYADYVPLRGLENVDDEGRPKPGVGRGANIRGQESTRALGRRSRAGEIVENIVRDYERAVIRGERNNVAKTFLDLVTTNPDPELWEVNAQKTNRSFSKTLGLVTTSTSTETGDDTIGVKVGGQQVYIKVKDPLLVRAMRQAAKDETGEFQSMLAKSLGVYNNWLRNTLTRYNPVFGAVNAVRDLQAGAVATLDKLGARGLKLYASHYRAALAASVRNEFDALGKQGAVFGDPVMDRWFDEYRRAGGTTAGWFLRDVEDIHTDIRQMLVAAGSAPRNAGERITGSVAWQGAKALLKYVELFGSASENAGRVAAYRAAREMGRSPAEAASIAKNLTTNFNRKGEWGTALSSAYLFFNAAVQGTARVLEALKSPRVQGLMAGVTGLAATLAVMGAEMGGDDDDGQAYWDKIPQHEKERNLIIMLPPGIQTDGAQKVGGMGRYIKIPMPYGFNVFATLGYTMADVGRNAVDPARGVKPAKAAINMVSAVAGSYNPMGGAFDVTDPVAVGMAVAPTIVDAGIQLGAGVNSFGTPVGPKGSPFDSRPDSERFTVTQGGGAAQRLARWVNEATGGNRARSGAIDLMPGTIENVVNMAGGGTGRFLMDVFVNVPTKLSGTGDEEAVFRYRDLPFLRNFAGQVDENVDRGLFYERMDEVLKEARTAKNEMKMGIVVKYDPRSRAMQSLGKMADGYSGLMTDLRKEDLQIVNDPSLSAPEKKMMRRDVEKRRNELVREFNRIWIETERDLARGSFDKE